MQRRLAAIVAADIPDFARLVRADEEGTLAAFKRHRVELVDPKVTEFQGRIVRLQGDGAIVEFPSVVAAVACAWDIQSAMADRNADVPSNRRMLFRIGVNLGEIIVESDRIEGEGVDIAARLESLAEPGGICVSAEVYRQVKRRLELQFQDLGEHRLEQSDSPVQVYKVLKVPGSKAPVATRSAEGKPVIAVLPFENLSGDEEQEHFCDGLTVYITTDLSKFRNFLVIAANSAFAYKGKHMRVQDIGQELGAKYILEGSVQRSEQRLRVNTVLVDAQQGHHLWSRRFNKDFSDLFDIQDEIIAHTVAELAPKVTAMERDRLVRSGTQDINAYVAFLRGTHQLATNLPFLNERQAAVIECRNWFEKATSLDPYYGRAWGWLGYTHVIGYVEGWEGPEALTLAKECTQKAVALEPEDYDTHWALAYAYSASGELDRALMSYHKALELNENDADLRAEMAESLGYLGHHREALEQIDHAMVINPRYPEWYCWTRGWVLHHLERYQESNAELQKILRPNNEVRLILAANHILLGNEEQAAEAMKAFLERRADWTVEKERQTLPYRNKKDEQRWLDALREAGLPER